MDKKFYDFRLKRIGIDLKDQKILDILRFNCRFNNAEIGKMINSTRESVKYRIQRLEKKGLIAKYRTFVNFDKVGLQKYDILIKFNDFSSIVRKNIIQMLKKVNYVYRAVTFYGEYDISIRVIVSQKEQLDYCIKLLKEKFGEKIINLEIMIGLNEMRSKTTFDIARPNLKQYSKGSFQKYFMMNTKKTNKKLDEKDKEILRFMASDARISIQDLARKTRISANTLYERIKRMILDGVITGFNKCSSIKSLGKIYHLVLIDFKKIDDKLKEQFETFMLNLPAQPTIHEYIGRWNYGIVMKFTDGTEVNEFSNMLKEKFHKSVIKINVLSYGGEQYYNSYYL